MKGTNFICYIVNNDLVAISTDGKVTKTSISTKVKHAIKEAKAEKEYYKNLELYY